MKRCGIARVAAALMVVTGWVATVPAVTLEGSKYYTWGIDPREVSIPDGYIIADAVVTLHGLTSTAENVMDTLVVYLLDNPPVGFHENPDIPGVDHFEAHGCRLTPNYTDRTQGYETTSYRLAAIDYPASWVWQVYERPFPFGLADAQTITCSSTLLELIDYVGNATPFGIGLDPADTGDFTLGGLSLTLTVQAFQGPPGKTQLQFTFADTNNPPIPQAPALRIFPEGVPFQLVFNVVDPDGDDVNISADTLPAGATFENGILSWTPPYGTAPRGSAVPFAVKLTASDGSLWTSRTFVIWVFRINRPPVLLGLTLLSAEDKTRVVYRVNAIDPDGDPITLTAAQLPPAAQFDPETRNITWDTTAVTPGIYDIIVAVSDGLLSQTRTFSIQVNGIDRPILGERQGSLVPK